MRLLTRDQLHLQTADPLLGRLVLHTCLRGPKTVGLKRSLSSNKDEVLLAKTSGILDAKRAFSPFRVIKVTCVQKHKVEHVRHA